MITPDQALALVAEHAQTLGSEPTPLASAADRILAEDLVARESLPPFDNSAMDGYAVRAEDLAGASPSAQVELRVREIIRAGFAGAATLRPGEAARIMTGAPLPPGADSVVMQELTAPGASGLVRIARAPEVGSHVRSKGEDVLAGATLLREGTAIRPYEISLLAAQGITEIPVIRRPRVTVIVTGDELVAPESRLAHGQIRNSNGPALLAALSRWGVPAVDGGIVADDAAALTGALGSALSQSDIVLVTGGVSVGDFDYTRTVFTALGIREVFWKVAIKPGKPLLFGVHDAPHGTRKLVFGLPGNPLAALICLEEFVRPALEKLQGSRLRHQSYHLAGTTANDYPKPSDRQQFLFCRADAGPDGYELTIIRPQGSAMVGMAAQANALAIAPLGVARVPKGATLRFRWLK